MGVQKNIKKLQEQVEVLGGALTRALKELDALKTLSRNTHGLSITYWRR